MINLGSVYNKMGKYEISLQYINKAIQILTGVFQFLKNGQRASTPPQLVEMIATAYFNAGV